MRTILNLEEASRLLHLSDRTVRDWTRAGKIPGRKIGGQWRYHRERLLLFVSGQDVHAENEDEEGANEDTDPRPPRRAA